MDWNLRKLFVIMGSSFFLWISFQAFEPIFPLYVDDLGVSSLVLGILMALPSFFSIIFRLPVAIIAKRIGRKRLILISLATQASSFMCLGFIVDLSSLFAARILHGIVESLFPTTMMAATYELTTPENRGKMFGVFFTSIGLAMISGPFLSGLLLRFLSFTEFFLVLSLFPTISLCIYLIGAPDGELNYSLNERYDGGTKSIRIILKNQRVLAVCLSRVLFSITVSIFATVFSVYSRDVLLITPSMISFLFVIRGTSNTLSRLPSGRISDAIGRKKPIMLSYMILAGVFYLFSEAESVVAFILIMTLFGLAWGLRIAPETALVSELVDSGNVGVAIALLQTMFPIGSVIGSISAGWLALSVSVSTIFKLSSLILISAAMVILAIRENQAHYNLRSQSSSK